MNLLTQSAISCQHSSLALLAATMLLSAIVIFIFCITLHDNYLLLSAEKESKNNSFCPEEEPNDAQTPLFMGTWVV